MNIILQYAITYENLYIQSKQPIFHIACGCILGQQVSFSIGRNMRKTLYENCGFPLVRENVNPYDLDKLQYLVPERKYTIQKLCEIDDSYNNEEDIHNILNKYSKIKGIGIWTINSIKLLLNLDDEINLSSDTYIRKNLLLYLRCFKDKNIFWEKLDISNKKSLTQKECHKLIDSIKEGKSKISYFLWRIKSGSIEKVAFGEELTIEDFI